MYEELVTALRKRAVELPEKFSKNAENIDLFLKAANAIEELQGRAKVLEKVADKWCETVPKWIPVTERLPETDGLYLVSVKNDHKRRYSKTAWYEKQSWFARQDVTHWMPLPEPPKEGE